MTPSVTGDSDSTQKLNNAVLCITWWCQWKLLRLSIHSGFMEPWGVEDQTNTCLNHYIISLALYVIYFSPSVVFD